ncbi:DUF2171 domain-containing protein [Plastoroseomonas hellenica]|nr:DUF2171 domain-containing protein [Plastoroseomonas hellenica]
MTNAARMERGEIQEHMPVVGSDGRPFGTVDRIAGAYIKLSKSDPLAEGEHRYLPRSTVAGLDGGLVRLSMPARQAWQATLTEAEMEQRLTLDAAERADLGVEPDTRPHGSRAHAHGGPKGQRQHGTSGQAPGPGGRLSFGAKNIG